ncbi:hypothetical protein [Sporisorium scitamineum]|uniref:Uncharacterized protein n=1 Tax=Sporisorium scitamineum TaxID=49012 RepID=A0A0F7S1R1_9BASI|nr:hypothetical protein [Sporisorium scitamineum]
MPGPAFYMALVEVFVAEGGEGGWRRYEGHQMQPTSASSELGSASAQKVLDAYEESKHT